MPDTPAPAEGATTETPKAEPAAQATLPPAVEAAMKQYGFASVEDMAKAAGLYTYASTPEGSAKLVQNVAQHYGVDIAKQVIASNPDAVFKDVDRETRRKVRRAVARRDQPEDVDTPDDEGETAPNPAVEAKAQAAEAMDLARKTAARQDTAAQAIGLAPLLVAKATKDERIASNFDTWRNSVLELIQTGHPRYQGGQRGIDAASDDVINQWSAYGKMAGLETKVAPTPKPGSDIPAPKLDDISKSVAEARETTRGRGASALVDEIMRKEFV